MCVCIYICFLYIEDWVLCIKDWIFVSHFPPIAIKEKYSLISNGALHYLAFSFILHPWLGIWMHTLLVRLLYSHANEAVNLIFPTSFYEDCFLRCFSSFNISFLSFLNSEFQVSMAGYSRWKEKVKKVKYSVNLSKFLTANNGY